MHVKTKNDEEDVLLFCFNVLELLKHWGKLRKVGKNKSRVPRSLGRNNLGA